MHSIFNGITVCIYLKKENKKLVTQLVLSVFRLSMRTMSIQNVIVHGKPNIIRQNSLGLQCHLKAEKGMKLQKLYITNTQKQYISLHNIFYVYKT